MLPNNQLFYSATVVEMTTVAQTNIEFYEIAHFLSKTTSFYKKLPPFYKKKTTDHLLIKNSNLSYQPL